MIHLDLSHDEQRVFAQMLEGQLAELRTEISHTDAADYRDLLKERKMLLGRILEVLHEEPHRMAS